MYEKEEELSKKYEPKEQEIEKKYTLSIGSWINLEMNTTMN